jgi:hypothetical protein
MTDRKTKLSPTAPVESPRQMLKGKIVDANHDRTGGKWWRRKLYVEKVDGMFSQFGAECQWDSNEWRVRQRGANRKIRPPVGEAFRSLAFSDIKRVQVDLIDFSKRWDQIGRVALVPG